MRRTSREGVAEAEAANRRLEIRVGVLITAMREAGELAGNGFNQFTQVGVAATTPTLDDHDIARQQAADFVLMAENPDIVDEVIAKSTNVDPPSRAKVVREIKQRKFERKFEAENKAAIASLGWNPTAGTVAAMRRTTAVLAPFAGAVRHVLEVADQHSTEDVRSEHTSTLWPEYRELTIAAINYLLPPEIVVELGFGARVLGGGV